MNRLYYFSVFNSANWKQTCGYIDRSHGNQYSQHIEDVHQGLDDYVTSLEKEQSYRQQTIEQLEQSELFYDIQYGEAKIVANVR